MSRVHLDLKTRAPLTPDPQTRTATVIAVTDNQLADGFRYAIAPDLSNIAIKDPTPVLLDHQNLTSALIGRATDFRAEAQQDGSMALVCSVALNDSDPANLAWPLIADGSAAWSVGVTFESVAPDGITVERWRLAELSLVAAAADPSAVTRAFKKQTAYSPEEIRKACARAKLPELADDLISRGASASEVRSSIINELADRQPNISSLNPWPTMKTQTPLESAVDRSFAGAQPLWLALRDAGVEGRSAIEVVTRALSTSDLPQLLLGTGDRLLRDEFQRAEPGLLSAATVRQLADYRTASSLGSGLIGGAEKLNEGGEIQFTSIAEEAASYKPSRWGKGFALTAEALANDDLGAVDRAFRELAASCLDAEANEILKLLEGSADGGLSPDGVALFDATHLNSGTEVFATEPLKALAEAIALLRGQRAIGGRYLDQQPRTLLCAPALELQARQVLSDFAAATAEEVNPWRSLIEVAVDPRLSGEFLYLIGDQRPIELGRLTQAPELQTMVEFYTSKQLFKAEHSFGTAITDHRGVVRLTAESGT